MNKKKTFLTMMRTIRLPFLVKTVKIIYCDVLSAAKRFLTVKNSDVKVFGRNFCPKIKMSKVFCI